MNDSNRGSLTVRLMLTLECLKLQKQDNQSSSSSSSEDTVDNYQPSPNYYVKIFVFFFFFIFYYTLTIASRYRLSALLIVTVRCMRFSTVNKNTISVLCFRYFLNAKQTVHSVTGYSCKQTTLILGN